MIVKEFLKLVNILETTSTPMLLAHMNRLETEMLESIIEMGLTKSICRETYSIKPSYDLIKIRKEITAHSGALYGAIDSKDLKSDIDTDGNTDKPCACGCAGVEHCWIAGE